MIITIMVRMTDADDREIVIVFYIEYHHHNNSNDSPKDDNNNNHNMKIANELLINMQINTIGFFKSSEK